MDVDLKLKVTIRKMGAEVRRTERRLELMESRVMRCVTEAARMVNGVKEELRYLEKTRLVIEQELVEREEEAVLFNSINKELAGEEEVEADRGESKDVANEGKVVGDEAQKTEEVEMNDDNV